MITPFSDPNSAANIFNQLSKAAWNIRENAFVFGSTKVGCALMTADGTIFSGCNVEHRFRSHDVHAEVNAISSMAAAGNREITHLLVVADRERFTPCGACMDWVMQFAAKGCLVAFQPFNGNPVIYSIDQLMPFYPS